MTTYADCELIYLRKLAFVDCCWVVMSRWHSVHHNFSAISSQAAVDFGDTNAANSLVFYELLVAVNRNEWTILVLSFNAILDRRHLLVALLHVLSNLL